MNSNTVSLRLPFNHSEAAFFAELQKKGIGKDRKFYIQKKSLDARNKSNICFEYLVTADEQQVVPEIVPVKNYQGFPPVIVGSGPAGMFAALRLLKYGIRSTIIEQGDSLSGRMKKIALFLKRGVLDERSNVCFGAGGAGTFSDGKLMTRIRSEHIPFFLDSLVHFGAPEEIKYLFNPHLGSNKIRTVVGNIFEYLQKNGVTCLFNTEMTHIEFSEVRGARTISKVLTTKGELITDNVFLASGHSSRNTYALLKKINVEMQFKPFAVGVRMQHRAETIDKIQYGKFAGHPLLGHAEYKLAHTWKEHGNRAVYSFCMCPGGYVMNSSSENGGVVTNGMSNWKRNAPYSNAAIVVNVGEADVSGEDCFRGLEFQRKIENDFCRAANPAGGSHYMPAQRVEDFLSGKVTGNFTDKGCLTPLKAIPLYKYFPAFINKALVDGIRIFSRKMSGIISGDALLIAPETRTSSSLRILRDRDSFQSLNTPGLYPVGEGAGYAGGITSSAVDGINAAEAFIRKIR